MGDPKQSIYRFRNADIYTYLKARGSFLVDQIYYLDTNFRSSKSLISALNTLFDRQWLELPKLGQALPYLPVRAGSKEESIFPDNKGALHFFAVDEANLLPFIAREIEMLSLQNVAILVKDRYEAQEVMAFLKTRGIKAITKSQTPIGKTAAFQAVRELFDAVRSPHDHNLAKIVMAGPFAHLHDFSSLKLLLSEGLVPFAKKVLEGILDRDILQVFERLLAWEQKQGDLIDFFPYFAKLDVEEGARMRMEVDEKAIQVMTMHVSKGLEFDVVFAIGLASRTPESEEEGESNAEKLRQLYVAMTRAKKRLYIPIIDAKGKAPSPLELFAKHFDGDFKTELTRIAATESITIEEVAPVILPALHLYEAPEEIFDASPRRFQPIFISSFTSLAKTDVKELPAQEVEGITLQSMPRGAETGVILHSVLQAIFSHVKPDFGKLEPWKELILQMVENVRTMLGPMEKWQAEMEFLYPTREGFIKGFIDLVFIKEGKLYFLDWKSNWLENYEEKSLQEAMRAGDYSLQASLYKEALNRYAPEMEFGGAYYVFIRGPAIFYVE